jgi:hypothetical protein
VLSFIMVLIFGFLVAAVLGAIYWALLFGLEPFLYRLRAGLRGSSRSMGSPVLSANEAALSTAGYSGGASGFRFAAFLAVGVATISVISSAPPSRLSTTTNGYLIKAT